MLTSGINAMLPLQNTYSISLKMYFRPQVSQAINTRYTAYNLPRQPKLPDNDRAIAALEGSRLLSQGGYMIVPQLFSKAALLAMFEEACHLFAGSKEERREGVDTEEWRGGVPPRQLLSSGGGPVQDRLYRAPALSMLISELIGTRVEASSSRASYSYYCRTGDHLALHRDVEKCDISVIVAVSDNTSPQEAGGELVVYPKHIHQPLSVVRENLDQGAVSFKLAAGETCILAGGMVPHLVRPVVDGQYRITAPMCFQVVVL